MHALCRYAGASFTLQGKTLIQFEVDADTAELQAMQAEFKDKELALDVTELKKKRSIDANAYFWKLCDEIAKKVGGDKDTVYLMLLQRYGVFDTIEVIEQGLEMLRPLYRYIDEIDHYTLSRFNADGEETATPMLLLNCYKGSSQYNTKQMADLINGTIAECTELGIGTLTDKELEKIKGSWRAK